MSPARRRMQGFTIAEMLVVVAILGIMAALAGTSLISITRQAQASGEARLLVYRLQSARTLSVSQGWPQGYYFGAPGDANPALTTIPWCTGAGCGFAWKNVAATAMPAYAQGQAQELHPFDSLPYVSNGLAGFSQLLAVTVNTTTWAGAASFTVGFDLNGLPYVNPPPVPLVWPICLAVQTINDPTTLRWVIIFSDGTTRIQQTNETYCV